MSYFTITTMDENFTKKNIKFEVALFLNLKFAYYLKSKETAAPNPN